MQPAPSDDRNPAAGKPGVSGDGRPTGIADCELSVRLDDIHLLGILHRTPMAIARLTGAITRYDPNLVAVETQPEVVASYHPDVYDPRWPPEHEVEAAAFAADRDDDLYVAGIDAEDWPTDLAALGELDAEIFTEMGLIDSPDDLSRLTYYALDLPMIRRWRRETERRQPEAFEDVLRERDAVMAGHLHALAQAAAVESIIAAIGVQHLTGVLDRLREPGRIPAERIDRPPVCTYHTV